MHSKAVAQQAEVNGRSKKDDKKVRKTSRFLQERRWGRGGSYLEEKDFVLSCLG